MQAGVEWRGHTHPRSWWCAFGACAQPDLQQAPDSIAAAAFSRDYQCTFGTRLWPSPFDACRGYSRRRQRRLRQQRRREYPALFSRPRTVAFGPHHSCRPVRCRCRRRPVAGTARRRAITPLCPHLPIGADDPQPCFFETALRRFILQYSCAIGGRSVVRKAGC